MTKLKSKAFQGKWKQEQEQKLCIWNDLVMEKAGLAGELDTRGNMVGRAAKEPDCHCYTILGFSESGEEFEIYLQ